MVTGCPLQSTIAKAFIDFFLTNKIDHSRPSPVILGQGKQGEDMPLQDFVLQDSRLTQHLVVKEHSSPFVPQNSRIIPL